MLKFPSKEIGGGGGVYGYRTKKSKKTQETWDFAQHYSGKTFLGLGILALVVTLLICPYMDVPFTGALVTIQSLSIAIPIFLTEKALSVHFDEYGNSRK